MSVLEQVQSDISSALKAGDRERAGALRLVASELQKAPKEGGGSEEGATAGTQLELPNDVASELAGPGDAIMRTLEGHLDCEVFLRGNVLTLDGGEPQVTVAETVVRELSDLVRQGHDLAPGTIEAITDALDHHASPSAILEDVVWRNRGKALAPKTVNQKRYVDAIRNNTVTVGIGPAGTGK